MAMFVKSGLYQSDAEKEQQHKQLSSSTLSLVHATIRREMKNFSTFNSSELSHYFYVRGLPWPWSCHADITICLRSRVAGADYRKQLTGKYSQIWTSKGDDDFMQWTMIDGYLDVYGTAFIEVSLAVSQLVGFKSGSTCESSHYADFLPHEQSTIDVHWQISGIRHPLVNGGIVWQTSKRFRHDVLPGIEYELAVFVTSSSPQLFVGIAPVYSEKKSFATAPALGFSLAFASTNDSGIAIKQQLAMTVFDRKKPWQRCHDALKSEVAKLCADDGSIILCGEIVVATPSLINCATRRMYESGRFSDFAIKVDGKTFNVHKNVLAETCPGFAELFANGQSEMEIRDSSADAVKAMLQFLYDDPLRFKGLQDLSCEVLALADKFGLLQLKEVCEVALIEMLGSTNALKFIGVAVKTNAKDLREHAFELVSKKIGSFAESAEWISLKKDHLTTAMEFCEFIVGKIAAEKLFRRSTARSAFAFGQLIAQGSAVDVAGRKSLFASLSPLEIPVRWQIPAFKHIMKSSQLGSSVVCLEKFSHESMPGIAWELILYPDGKDEHNHHVALFMRPLLTSSKKSQATAPFGGFSLRFRPIAADNGLGPPKQVLEVQQFANRQSERGILKFAHQPLIDTHCLAPPDSSVVLSGSILIEPANRQTVFVRKALESGDHSDFSIKVDEESFAVHKNILSQASPTMEAMFKTSCKEVSDGGITIKETTVEAVRALLQFWYGDPLCFEGLDELSMEVYKLANRYQEFELRQMCEDALLRMVSRDNVVFLAAFAADQGCEPLEKMAAKFIIENSDVLQNDAWSQLKEENFTLALTIAERIISKYRNA